MQNMQKRQRQETPASGRGSHQGGKREAHLEAVEHPSHYGGDTPHEVIKCLEAWGLENDAMLWNAVKCIARAGKKGPRAKALDNPPMHRLWKLEDLKKAAWYLARRIKSLEEVKQ